MKFIKLELLNLASLDREEGETIDFENGALGDSTIFSIVGPTGSGKSTILDAICLALYNRAPRYPRKKNDKTKIQIFGEPDEGESNRLSPTDSRNILTRGKKSGYSKLTFLANDGTCYRAEWYVQKKIKKFQEAQTSLYKISSLDTSPTEEQVEWTKVPDIIGLDYDQFLRTVLIAQGSFASFVKAKEDERYELLEKLIGCDSLYTDIALRIKRQKDEAVGKYESLRIGVAAKEKDILSDEEFEKTQLKLAQLENEERKIQEELVKVSKAITWYDTDRKQQENISQFEKAYREALQRVDDNMMQEQRLKLHDETLPAATLYREIINIEKQIARLNKELNEFEESIKQKSQAIKTEEETNLANLKQAAQKASLELQQFKPHINVAREIKAQLTELNKTLTNKSALKDETEEAKKKAEQDLNNNHKAISLAEQNLMQLQQAFDQLKINIDKDRDSINSEVKKAVETYTSQEALLQQYDGAQLQENKTKAEKTAADLQSAIRIQSELTVKWKQLDDNKSTVKHLTEENIAIEAKLQSFDLESLVKELEKLNNGYTLMNSDNVKLMRVNLVDGEPCPLCGSKHHVYHEADVPESIVDGIKQIIDEKRTAINQLRQEREDLTKLHAENVGKLKSLENNETLLTTEINKLKAEWASLHAEHTEWAENIDVLKALDPELKRMVQECTEDLNKYNQLLKDVDKLRKEKEKAEQKQSEFDSTSRNKLQEAEKAVNEANTSLLTRKSQTEHLQAQVSEKTKAAMEAVEEFNKVEAEVNNKKSTLTEEIGARDPETFESELEKAKETAEKAVAHQTEVVSLMKNDLNLLKGKETASKSQREQETKTLESKKGELTEWLIDYNQNKSTPIGEEVLAQLCSCTDDWEEIRANNIRLKEQLTISDTTLKNEVKANVEHQTQKPDAPIADLMRKKEELSNHSSAELTECKVRIQRHEEAKTTMGEMFTRLKDAETLKREWEEIVESIGADGKTLRKIAQCYTLRFLVEHSNAEIRKFNSRYELVQVKNSLGLRVIDHDRADDVRDVTSLSGGETFIISLGLALGLSSLSSRNISFGNLFIDEGFGTLDPDTLDTVIDSLSILQSSQGKKVCVISHTDTMSERIGTQIRVIKHGNTGSSHIEIYP